MPWHDDAFLLLPGDGFCLLDADGTVIHADRFLAESVLDAPGIGDDLREAWPELARQVDRHAEDVAVGGPVDVVVERGDARHHCRIFRTDTGLGVGVLAATVDRAGSGPAFAMYDRVLRSVNESVVVTTAEPFDRPGPIIVYVNDAFLRDTGYQRHEVIGRSPRLLQPDDVAAAPRTRFRQTLEGWGRDTIAIENVRKDGSRFWVEIDVAPVADDTGWYTHWVSVQQDITARMADEADREARRAMVRAILDSLPSQSALLDRDGRIVATNAQWQGLWRELGRGPEPDWVGVDYLEVCRRAARSTDQGAVDAQAALDGVTAVLSGELSSFGLDYEMAVEGTSLWYHLEVLPLRGNEGVVVTHADITRRKVAEEELGYRSRHDVLTGLANRQALLDRLGDALAQGSPVGLVLIDLDGFKHVNDAFGHVYGDRLLESVSRRLETLATTGQLVARLGGDEFAILAVDIEDGWDHERLCQRIREALAEPVNLDITSVRPSASFGIVTSPPHRGDAEAMLRDADTALYVSKDAGRDRWTLFRDDQRVSARARAVSQARIEQALADGEFVLHFQPFIDLVTGRTVGSEALLRWAHPEEGLLAPGTFLAAVESGPMLDEVGAWVLDAAIATLARWQAVDGHARHLMSINVSPKQLGRGRLPGLVVAALERHGVAPATVGLEVLESALLTSGATVEAELRDLHAMGVRVAIDDFGTGYSALAYLQTFPVDAVKIDRAFVQRSGTPRGARLLRATGEIARAVDATSIAEGIETAAELAAVQAAGIAWGQGYLLGRPTPAGPAPAASAVTVTP